MSDPVLQAIDAALDGRHDAIQGHLNDVPDERLWDLNTAMQRVALEAMKLIAKRAAAEK